MHPTCSGAELLEITVAHPVPSCDYLLFCVNRLLASFLRKHYCVIYSSVRYQDFKFCLFPCYFTCYSSKAYSQFKAECTMAVMLVDIAVMLTNTAVSVFVRFLPLFHFCFSF